MSTSLLPILSMLTSGTLGDMLSPSKSIEEKQSKSPIGSIFVTSGKDM